MPLHLPVELPPPDDIFDMLRWCRANGCPLYAGTCAAAAEDDHLEPLNGDVLAGDCEASGFGIAANMGRLEVLRWRRRNGCPSSASTSACDATGERLDILMVQAKQVSGK